MSRLGREESAGAHLRKVAHEIQTVARSSRNQSITGLDVFRSSLVSLIILMILGATMILSISEEARMTLIQKFASGWSLLKVEEPDFHQLAPPKPDLSNFVVGALSSGMKNGDPGNLPDEELPSGDFIKEVREKVLEIPSKDSNFEKAFNLLAENSEFIRALILGGFPDLLFDDWQPIRAVPPNYWLLLEVQDVVAGEAIKLAWSFNIDTLKANPENQSARDQFFEMKMKEE